MWQLVAISAYTLLAVVALVDKILLTGPVRNPAVYTFYTTTLALAVLVLIPLGFNWPGVGQLVLALLAGFTFALALLLYYQAAKRQEISRVIPAIAGFLPVFTLFNSFLFLGDRLNINQLAAFALLVVGGVVITIERGMKSPLNIKNLRWVIAAAFTFSIAFVLTKAVFNAQPFWSGFIWMRLGGFLFALLLLAFSQVRHALKENITTMRRPSSFLFVANQGIAATAFILQNYAILLGPVALINALESFRHVFLLILTVIFSKFYATILKERIFIKVLAQKLIAISLIALGLILLFI